MEVFKVNNYEVEIEGKMYRVTIEEISKNERQEKKQTAGKKDSNAKNESKETPPVPLTTNAQKILSPMPGNVFKVLVSAGEYVKKGEAVLILEAMKMENEIVAPHDGTISAVHVKEGQAVDSDDVLFEV